VLLGIAAMACLIWAAVNQFGVAWSEMLDLFLATLLALFTVIISAAVAVAIWAGLRWLVRRD
jgi:hypothetical protein